MDQEKLEFCKTWLKEFLPKNTGLIERVKEEAKKQGFSKEVLKQARKELRIKTFHQFDENNSPTENYFWSLP